MIMVTNYRSMLVIWNKEHLGNIDFFLNDEPIKLCDVQNYFVHLLMINLNQNLNFLNMTLQVKFKINFPNEINGENKVKMTLPERDGKKR